MKLSLNRLMAPWVLLMAILLVAPAAWADGVEINGVTVDQNVKKNGVYGLQVNSDITVDGYEGDAIRVEAFFNFEGSGAFVQAAHNGRYRASDGTATTQEIFNIGQAHERRGFSVFIPYSELNIPLSGHVALTAHVVVRWQRNREELGRSARIPFGFTWNTPPSGGQSSGGLAPVNQNPSQRTTLHRVWVSNPTDHPVALRYRTDNPNSRLQTAEWVVPARYENFLSYNNNPFVEDGFGFFQVDGGRWRALKDVARLETITNITGWRISLWKD